MSSNYPPNYPPSVPPPAPAVVVKKTSPWVWVLAGCGTLLVISIIAIAGLGFFTYRKLQQSGLDPALARRSPTLAAAKMVVMMNPELEFVSMDEKNSTITIREKKTGKTLTVNAKDIQEGRITFSDDQNENVSVHTNSNSGSFEIKTGKETVKFGAGSAADVPKWIPAYPGAAAAQGMASMRSSEGSGGSYGFSTEDSVEDVLTYFEDALESEGFKVTNNSAKVNGQVGGGTLTARDANNRRTTAIVVSATGSVTSVTVTYQDKN
ncbi:MAG: hypothetical protein WKF84_25835 [Pyrinomonadaceae bacterium]